MFAAKNELRHWRIIFFIVALSVLVLAVLPLSWPVHSRVGMHWRKKLVIGEMTLDHLIAFGAMTWLAARAWPRRLHFVVPLLLVYGFMIEVVQLYVPYRTADFTDVAADAVGIVIGLALVAIGSK